LEPLIKAASKMHERRNINEEILQSIIHPQKIFEHLAEEQQSVEPIELVVIGGCTGGTKSLFALLAKLPEDLNIPVVIVQHLPRTYTKILAEKLNTVSHLMIREATNGVVLQDGDVWIAPGGYHCEIGQNGYQQVINVHRGVRENDMRPSIDILFRSAAKIYGEKTLGIILSGCGCDGIAGSEEIKLAGGQIIVQDPQTSIAPELPLSIIRNGFTREYYSPEELANQIVQRASKINVDSEITEQETSIGDSLIF
ncbi:MAG TPA: CheB methylesterase domain-containing protein, partial [Balneolaceae bacterium]|nr:CheB methylesterase domain-containing protein [Balneolaceae bacterium]